MEKIDKSDGLFGRLRSMINLVDKLSISYGEKIYPIILNIHTDGAPLVRTTKSSIWPCMASLVELPPQIREMKRNIVVFVNAVLK